MRIQCGQPKVFQGNPEVEQAFTICRATTGQLARGSNATGGRYNVSLEITCPHGHRALGVFHTHPGGTCDPSEADMREARRRGLGFMCIGVPGTREIKCHKVR